MEADDVRRDKAQALAIAQAVREALVDRTLHEHTERLNQINGSQMEMAKSLSQVDHKLDALASTFKEQTAIQTALAEALADQRGQQFSRKTIWIALCGVIAAYGSMIALIVTSKP